MTWHEFGTVNFHLNNIIPSQLSRGTGKRYQKINRFFSIEITGLVKSLKEKMNIYYTSLLSDNKEKVSLLTSCVLCFLFQ